MIPIFLILCLYLLTDASAMEGPVSNPPETTDAPSVQTHQTEWEKIQELYSSYQNDPHPTTRIQIIQGLYHFLNRGKLDQTQKEETLAIARTLKADNLARLIEWDENTGDYGNLTVVPKEILHEIILFLGQGRGELKDLKSLIQVNKSFYRIVASAPVHLDLSPYKKEITDDILAQIIELFSSVVSLDLSFCNRITNAGLEHLKGLTQLTSLKLSWCEQITDAGLEHVKALTQLATLDLNGCSITDAGLEHLKGLIQLTILDLAGCSQITDAGLKHLKGLIQLTNLKLTGCSITDTGLEHLKGLTQLTSLDLSWCEQITDGGLEYLKGLTQLSTLSLSLCNRITDAGLEHLKGLPQLTTLYLAGCEKITPHGEQSLKEALPRLTIYPKRKTKTAF